VRVVVDTNVIAYFLLGTQPFRSECDGFWERVEDAAAPAFWEAELANVLWLAVRTNVLGLVEALQRLDLGRALVRSVPITDVWHGALVRACDSGVAVYDALFVELAVRERLPLATFDGAVLAAFPEIARRPGELLGGGG
jgi:predicted nucleic acid-binding protein